MKITIPGTGELEINTVVLDLNGTLSVGGRIIDGIKDRLDKLKERGLRLILFSGDTRGDAADLAAQLGIEFIQAGNAQAKFEEICKLDPETCAAIGNGLIDLLKIKAAKIGIVTLQAEGIHTQTLLAADIVVPSILDALDLFLDEQRLIATLRK